MEGSTSNLLKTMKLVAFDLDGTLCNTIADISASLNRALARSGFATYTDEQIKSMVGKSVTYMCQRAMPKGHENDWIRVQCDYIADYDIHLCDNTRPYDGILEVLAELQRRGYILAVVTNKPHAPAVKIVETIFAHHGDDFRLVRGQAEKYPIKPNPDTLQFVMDYLGVAPQDTYYVGDSEVDIQFAKNAHVQSIGCSWGYRSRKVLEDAGASFIADKPQDILSFIK